MITERDGLGIATVLARKGRSAALAQRIREHFQIELPHGPRRAAAGDLALIGTGPGAWLAVQERGGNAFAISLRKAIGDLASISDQSDGYVVFRLSGLNVRDTLSKLVSVDVHPRAFEVGAAASTAAAHIAVILWRLEDEKGGSPVFDTAVYRSLAASFRHQAEAALGATTGSSR